MEQEKVRKVVRQLMRVDRAHHSIIDQKVGKMGIHRSQHMMLMHLSHLKETPSQIELCRHFDISAPAVAGTLKKLEKEGYITRASSAADGRVNEISITDKGREMVENTRHIFDGVDRAMLEGLREEDITKLGEILGKMQSNLERAQKDETMV